MCNNCNCDNYDQCSIVGYMPIGFCCSKCRLYDPSHTCLNMQTRRAAGGAKGADGIEMKKEKREELRPISTTIENGILKVELGEEDKKKFIFIDLQKHLELE